jgi:hypothetical protein
LAVTKGDPSVDVTTDDRAIRAELLAELMGQEWFKTQALRVAAENVAGVRRLEEHIIPSV